MGSIILVIASKYSDIATIYKNAISVKPHQREQFKASPHLAEHICTVRPSLSQFSWQLDSIKV